MWWGARTRNGDENTVLASQVTISPPLPRGAVDIGSDAAFARQSSAGRRLKAQMSSSNTADSKLQGGGPRFKKRTTMIAAEEGLSRRKVAGWQYYEHCTN